MHVPRIQLIIFVLITEAVEKLVDSAVIFDQIQNSTFKYYGYLQL